MSYFRERPLGCRTIFIGGLPELATQEVTIKYWNTYQASPLQVVEEIFGKCGEIQTLRMSKKSFCHIRYAQVNSISSCVTLCLWPMLKLFRSSVWTMPCISLAGVWELATRQTPLPREGRIQLTLWKSRHCEVENIWQHISPTVNYTPWAILLPSEHRSVRIVKKYAFLVWGQTCLVKKMKSAFLCLWHKKACRIHVDYAAARDDQYEFECKQRELERLVIFSFRQKIYSKNQGRRGTSPSLSSSWLGLPGLVSYVMIIS